MNDDYQPISMIFRIDLFWANDHTTVIAANAQMNKCPYISFNELIRVYNLF